MIKTILITGASRGIGKQLALQYAAPHVNLILIAQQSAALLEVAASCENKGAYVDYAYVDSRDKLKLAQFIETIDEKMPIDLVIANAGISSTLRPNWEPEPLEKIQQVFDINLYGTLNTIQPLIGRMIDRKKGQIVIMSSLAGLYGFPQSPGYCASKAALYTYGQSLRCWLSRYHVKVNVVCPGYVKTDMSDNLTGFKPFRLSSEKAACLIRKGIATNKACLIFPWQLKWLARLLFLLPPFILDRLLQSTEVFATEE